MTITGECGHTGPFDDWTATPINGDLPPGHFQCPVCRRAFRMVKVEEGQRYPSGLWIPPKYEPRECPSTL